MNNSRTISPGPSLGVLADPREGQGLLPTRELGPTPLQAPDPQSRELFERAMAQPAPASPQSPGFQGAADLLASVMPEVPQAQGQKPEQANDDSSAQSLLQKPVQDAERSQLPQPRSDSKDPAATSVLPLTQSSEDGAGQPVPATGRRQREPVAEDTRLQEVSELPQAGLPAIAMLQLPAEPRLASGQFAQQPTRSKPSAPRERAVAQALAIAAQPAATVPTVPPESRSALVAPRVVEHASTTPPLKRSEPPVISLAQPDPHSPEMVQRESAAQPGVQPEPSALPQAQREQLDPPLAQIETSAPPARHRKPTAPSVLPKNAKALPQEQNEPSGPALVQSDAVTPLLVQPPQLLTGRPITLVADAETPRPAPREPAAFSGPMAIETQLAALAPGPQGSAEPIASAPQEIVETLIPQVPSNKSIGELPKAPEAQATHPSADLERGPAHLSQLPGVQAMPQDGQESGPPLAPRIPPTPVAVQTTVDVAVQALAAEPIANARQVAPQRLVEPRAEPSQPLTALIATDTPAPISAAQDNEHARRRFEQTLEQVTPIAHSVAGFASPVIPTDVRAHEVFTRERLCEIVERLMVSEVGAPNAQVRMVLREDFLPGVTVSVQQAAGQLVVAFDCTVRASQARLDRTSASFARTLAQRTGREVVVHVRDSDDAESSQLEYTGSPNEALSD